MIPDLTARMIKLIDRGAMERAQAIFAGVWADKFFHVDEYCQRAAEKAFALGLGNPPAKRILDIGCGFGYLCLAAELLGHRAIGIDVDHDCTKMVSRAVPFSFCAFDIHSHVGLPDLGEFDLVTIMGVNFAEGAAPEGFWKEDDYRFLIADIYGILRPGGIIHLEHNRGLGLDFLDTVQWPYPYSVRDNQIRITK